jgi:LacI family transcriptional regulator, galactose operon repressor
LKNPKVTLSDVAERAGMSAATASRALRGLKVHKKYQGKAEVAAAELGYVVNEAARSLRSVRTMAVGMVYHDLTSMLGMELLRSITAGLDEIGYSLFVSTAQGKNDKFDQLVHRLLQRRVDALVLVHSNGEGGDLGGYAANGVPVMALITKAGGYSDLPMVSPTTHGASLECVESLRKHGHKLVVLLTAGRLPMPLNSFISAAKTKRMKLVQHAVGDSGMDARATLKALMAMKPRPTAVVALQAEAAKLLDAAPTLKIKIPDDLSIVAIRDRSVPSLSSTTLSTIHLDPRIMGEMASDLLKAWLTDGAPLDADRTVEIGSFIERTSTGPARE